MALQGNLDDFNILNILQMIKLEGKTGRLTLTEGDDMVKITFDNGAIIYAEGSPHVDEARIEGVLLSNKLIDPAVWQEIKREHENKLRPYWELLAKRTSSKLLVELIRRQVVDTVYRALRWEKGDYDVAQMKNLKYNSKIMSPIDVDALLMEGCRIADEWPRIALSLPPLETFIVKNILGEADMDASLETKNQAMTSGDFTTSLEYEILSDRGVTLSNAEIAVLSIIDRGKTVQEILDCARQGNFESLEAVKSLLRRGIATQSKKKKKDKATYKSENALQLFTGIILLAIVVGGFIWQSMLWPQMLEAQKNGIIKVKRIQAVGGLKKIEHDLKVFISINKTVPKKLENLVETGILKKADLIDPWNNPYKLIYKGNSFTLYSTGPDSFLGTDNVYLPAPI